MNSVVVEAMVGVGEVVERASGRQQCVGVTGVCAQMVSQSQLTSSVNSRLHRDSLTATNVFREMTSADTIIQQLTSSVK